MTCFLLIRHAEPETGPDPAILCGRTDVGLSGHGRAQLHDLVTRHAGLRPADALYSSPLRRARETAAVLADTWQLPLRLDPDLQEIDCGDLDGRPILEVQRDHPELWARNAAQDDDDFGWPGGESYRAFRARVFTGLMRLAAAHPDGRVVIVTHAGVIGQILGAAHQYSAAAWEPFRPRYISLSEILWAGPEAIQVLRFDVMPWR